jgi:hypothetical protein
MKYLLRFFFGLILGLSAIPAANAFNHPGIPLTTADLNYVKAHLNQQPWKAGWEGLEASGFASLNYVEGGPFATVSRTPDLNLPQFGGDMAAVYCLALRWYYSGDSAYADKALGIWRGWISTMTTYGGSEAYLDMGDNAEHLFGGPEILRTYSGWTAADTTNSVNFFNNVIKPALGGGPPFPVRGANQGMAQIMCAMAIAVFCDDNTYWNQALFAYRNDGGLPDIAPLGMMGDTGRDAGHWDDEFNHLAWASAVAWSQGVDLFSEQNNQLALCAEYFSMFDQAAVIPYAPFGTIYGLYPTITQAGGLGADLGYRTIIQTAYETRKGLSLPWTDQMTAVWGDASGFQYYLQADPSTATYSPQTPHIPPAPLTAGALTDVDIGSPGLAGSSSYNSGTKVWTVNGSGADVSYRGADQFHFVYKAMSGDFVIVARVLSQTPAGTSAKAGLMVRDSLAVGANYADIHMCPTTVEQQVRGALAVSHGDNITYFTQAMPYWVKIDRRGNWVGRFISADGINWQRINYAEMGTTFNAGATVYVGMEVCAFDNTKLMTATMDNVAISPSSGPGPAPMTPTNLAVTAGNGQATLTWIPGAGATLCNVLRALPGKPYYIIAANVAEATYTDTTLTNGSTYYYVVSGTNSVGVSANSAQVFVTPSASAAVPAAPAGLTAYSAGGGVGLTWPAVSGATSYNVERAIGGGPFTTLFCGQGRAIPSFTDLTAGNVTTYYYVVTAVNANGQSPQSNMVSGRGFPAPGNYSLKNRSSGLMLDSLGSITDGTSCAQWAADTSPNQQWLVSYSGTNVVNLECGTGEMYLDGLDHTASGSFVGLWPYSGSTNQSWTIIDVGGGYYKLQNMTTGLCVDVGAGPWANGTPVQQWPSDGSYNQQWQLVAPQ